MSTERVPERRDPGSEIEVDVGWAVEKLDPAPAPDGAEEGLAPTVPETPRLHADVIDLLADIIVTEIVGTSEEVAA